MLKKYKSFVKLLEGVAFDDNIDMILNEGGGYGHLLHPYEDMSLTFTDFKKMADEFINASFTESSFKNIKTDGQNLLFSFIDGNIRFARNNGQVKNSGKTSMTIDEISKKFDGRGNIQLAFDSAARDLQKAVSSLKSSDVEKIFANGKKFVSVEVIFTQTENVIPYGQDLLVFHGTLEYDDDGNVIKEDNTEGKLLSTLIEDANEAAQKTFYIRGPEEAVIKPLPNASSKLSYYNNKIDKIIKDNDLSNNSTVEDFLKAAWLKYLKSAVSTTDALYDILLQRFVNRVTSYSLVNIKTDDPFLAEWIKEFEKKDFLKKSKEIRMPLESIFLELGADILQNISSALLANPTKSNELLRAKIDNAISVINSTGNDLEKDKLGAELNRMNIAGGLDKLNAVEGVTFKYKGKVYKWTGLFAAINQALGILNFRK